MEKSKVDKLDKEIEKALDNIYLNFNDKKWKPTKANINVFLKRFQ